jgi:hypothetical protein
MEDKKRKVLRNMVFPELGLHILNEAIKNDNKEKQTKLIKDGNKETLA